MAQVLDYSAGFPGALAIVRAGFVGAVRYIGLPDRRKCTTRAEFEEFSRNGLGMALVFEDSATNWRRGYIQGQLDAQRARLHADQIGFPAGRPIYLAVDQQVITDAEHASAVAYIRGAVSVLGFVNTGVYGQYSVIEACRNECDYFWQCRAWSGTPVKYSEMRDLFQRVGTVNVGGIGCDINDVLAPDWGQHNAGGGDVSAQDVVDGLNQIKIAGPDTTNGIPNERTFVQAVTQHGVWLGEVLDRQRAMEGALTKTETDVLAAVAGVKGELLAAVAAIDPNEPVSEEQLQRLLIGLRTGLGDELAEDIGRRLLGQEGNPA